MVLKENMLLVSCRKICSYAIMRYKLNTILVLYIPKKSVGRFFENELTITHLYIMNVIFEHIFHV